MEATRDANDPHPFGIALRPQNSSQRSGAADDKTGGRLARQLSRAGMPALRATPSYSASPGPQAPVPPPGSACSAFLLALGLALQRLFGRAPRHSPRPALPLSHCTAREHPSPHRLTPHRPTASSCCYPHLPYGSPVPYSTDPHRPPPDPHRARSGSRDPHRHTRSATLPPELQLSHHLAPSPYLLIALGLAPRAHSAGSVSSTGTGSTSTFLPSTPGGWGCATPRTPPHRHSHQFNHHSHTASRCASGEAAADPHARSRAGSATTQRPSVDTPLTPGGAAAGGATMVVTTPGGSSSGRVINAAYLSPSGRGGSGGGESDDGSGGGGSSSSISSSSSSGSSRSGSSSGGSNASCVSPGSSLRPMRSLSAVSSVVEATRGTGLAKGGVGEADRDGSCAGSLGPSPQAEVWGRGATRHGGGVHRQGVEESGLAGRPGGAGGKGGTGRRLEAQLDRAAREGGKEEESASLLPQGGGWGQGLAARQGLRAAIGL